jgi:HD superfamily phosphodiesterase
MSSPRSSSSATSSAVLGAQEKTGFRTKTIATRITPEELREVEAAAEKSGKTLAVWLRELALNAARERPADPTELMLAELSALRYMLLNLFHASASAQTEGKYLLPESVVKIRDKAEARKLADARKLLTDFRAREDGAGGAK